MSRYDNILASLPEVSRYLEAQERDLLAQGFERLWKEQTSALGPRIALEEAISFARTGILWSSPNLPVGPIRSRLGGDHRPAGKERREPSNPLDGD